MSQPKHMYQTLVKKLKQNDDVTISAHRSKAQDLLLSNEMQMMIICLKLFQ